MGARSGHDKAKIKLRETTRSGKTRTEARGIDEIRNTKSSNTDAFTLIPEGKRKRVQQRETGGGNGKEASGEMTQRRR